MICPKCGNEFYGRAAISRINKNNICPECGTKEALNDAVASGMISQESADKILENTNRLELQKYNK